MNPRALLVLTMATAAGLAVLIGLGSWQLERLAWKEGLITRIEARTKAAPVSLGQALAHFRATGDVEYLRVRAAGRFDHEEERHLYAIVDGQPGWRVVTPLHTDDGHVVLVDRGFVPEALKSPASRRAGQVEGRVEIVGLARGPERPGMFTPDNDPERNTWFWRDLDAMASGIGGPETGPVAPFFLEMERAAVPGGYPRGGITRLDLPNRHREYAWTWFGLAATLLAVYFFFLISQLRNARRDD